MMSRSVKALIVAAAVLLVLGAALAVLLLTKTTPTPAAAVSDNGSQTGVNAYIIDRRADEVTSIGVANSEGGFTFTRQTRTADSKSEYFWTSAELKGIPQDDSTVRNFIANLASLPEKSTVEEHASDLGKYGLADPVAAAELAFEDGTSAKLLFGIQNPVDTSSVYFRMEDSDTVHLVNYYAVAGALSDVRRFAVLKLTESYDSANKNELEYLKITRPDLASPIEIRYKGEPQSEEGMTFNTHRFVSPIAAEVDASRGRAVLSGVYALTMTACEFLEQTPVNLKKCGLDEPAALVEFTLGDTVYELTIGGRTNGGYYVTMKGVAGIYSLAEEKAPWVRCTADGIVSSRPLSPYIYLVESVEVTVPDGTYKFDIDGENKSFSCGGKELPSDEFKSFYRTLIGAVGEELYTGEAGGELIASVTFRYKNGGSDTLSYYADGERDRVALNGEVMYRVRRAYTDRLAENVEALLGGGEVRVDF